MVKGEDLTMPKEKVGELIHAIELETWSSMKVNGKSISLFSGTSGVILFYAYLYKSYKRDDYLQKCLLLLDSCFDLLSS